MISNKLQFDYSKRNTNENLEEIMMKKRMLAAVLTLCLMFSMVPASAQSWDCSTGDCVATNKPCGQLTDCTDGSCEEDNCVTCGDSDWIGKLLATLAAIGVTVMVVNELAD